MKLLKLGFAVIFATLASTASFAQVSQMTAGSYTASVSPGIDGRMARGIKNELKKISALDSVSVNAHDSSIHFDVKEGQYVDIAQLNNAVARAAPSVSLTAPTLISAKEPMPTTTNAPTTPSGDANTMPSPSANTPGTSPTRY